MTAMTTEVINKGQIKYPTALPKDSVTLSSKKEETRTWKSILPSCVITLKIQGK